MKTALVIVDMQNDFIDGALGTAEAAAIVPHVVDAVRRAALDPDTRLVFTQDTHGDDYLNTAEGRKLPVPHCLDGTHGHAICDALAPFAAKATVLRKPTFGCVELPAALADCERFVVMGLCTDICVISNALLLKAFYPERPIAVDARGCAGVTPQSHANALAAMKMCQIDLI